MLTTIVLYFIHFPVKIFSFEVESHFLKNNSLLLGDPEVTTNLYCNFAYLYWEGCVICSIYFICGNFWVTQYVTTTYRKEIIELKDMTKVYTNILFLIKFAIKRFVIEIKPKMLSVSDGRTYERTQ